MHVMTSAEAIVPVWAAAARRQGAEPGLARGSLGPEEEAAVWKGWTAFSSRAFQNLPGASLKQREEAGKGGGQTSCRNVRGQA